MYFGPWLPYSADALAPRGMSLRTVQIHHDRIHQSYADRALGFLDWFGEVRGLDISEIIRRTSGKPELEHVNTAFAEVLNHFHFWIFMSPSGGEIPGRLEKAITKQFGSIRQFKAAFKSMAARQTITGWVWLVQRQSGELRITRSGAISPLSSESDLVLLGCDVAEHSYYLDFEDRKLDYVGNWLDRLANYEMADGRLW